MIQEAVKFMNEKNFKEGLRKLAKAKEMGIPEKEKAINELEQEIRAQKEQNSALKKLGTWLGKLIDED